MAYGLVPCPGCARHVRTDETACPFCTAALPACAPPPEPAANGPRLNRAAIVALGASLALTGCAPVALYGAPAPDVVEDDGGLQAMYGAPAPDAAADDGGSAPLYGAAPPSDGG
jgi:hypothetical protein